MEELIQKQFGVSVQEFRDTYMTVVPAYYSTIINALDAENVESLQAIIDAQIAAAAASEGLMAEMEVPSSTWTPCYCCDCLLLRYPPGCPRPPYFPTDSA